LPAGWPQGHLRQDNEMALEQKSSGAEKRCFPRRCCLLEDDF